MKHPSDALYKNAIKSFEEALEVVEAEFTLEKSLWPEEEAVKPTFTEGLKEAQALKAEYLQHINVVREQLLKEWEKRGGMAERFAIAYFSGDYSHLAI